MLVSNLPNVTPDIFSGARSSKASYIKYVASKGHKLIEESHASVAADTDELCQLATLLLHLRSLGSMRRIYTSLKALYVRLLRWMVVHEDFGLEIMRFRYCLEDMLKDKAVSDHKREYSFIMHSKCIFESMWYMLGYPLPYIEDDVVLLRNYAIIESYNNMSFLSLESNSIYSIAKEILECV